MQVRSLGGEDLLEKEMTTHSSILAWRIPRNRGAWRATVHGVPESDTTALLHSLTHSLIHRFILTTYPSVVQQYFMRSLTVLGPGTKSENFRQ